MLPITYSLKHERMSSNVEIVLSNLLLSLQGVIKPMKIKQCESLKQSVSCQSNPLLNCSSQAWIEENDRSQLRQF